MARYEKDLGASARDPLGADQLLALLGEAGSEPPARSAAVACFLAGGDGWEDALQQLRGAFAEREQG